MDCRYFQKFLGFEWPNLEESDTCPEYLIPHGCSYNDGGLPRLRHLSIVGGFNWPITGVKHITTLELRGPVDLKLAIFAEFFRMNTSLESLNLINVHTWASPSHHQENTISLPHLNELSICDEGATCGRALALLTLPSLKSLSVFSAGQSFRSDSPWSEFCSRLPISSLEAQYGPPSGGSITMAGSDGLGAQSLYFRECSFKATGTVLFRSLSSPSLSSVTSFSFIKDMPEKVMTLGQNLAICDLLKHLSRVESIHLCPTLLAIRVLRKLRDDSELCPRLRELGVMIAEKYRARVVNLVDGMLRIRGGGGGWEVRIAKCPHPIGPQRGGELRTQLVWKKVDE